jgi:pyruvate kinase
MKSLTKIIATIGPSSDNISQIEELINSGVDIFRFNFKHGEVEWHSERIIRVNEVAKKLNRHIGTLIDLQGPEIRINIPQDKISIEKGEKLTFGPDAFLKDKKGFSITHPHIINHLKDGQQIYVDDGYFSFLVKKNGDETYLESQTTGILENRKSLNIPGADFPFPVIIDRDFEGLKLAAKNSIDFIALSMVRSAQDLKTVRNEALKFGVTGKLVAKIETQKALDDIDNIIDESDGVMIARGDLGVEIPIEQVPFFQKMIIKKCRSKAKFVITATQMLQSMIENPFPTRAEVSDIANAVYDYSDCLMLSGETANGKHPLKAVEMMEKTAIFYETKTEHLSGYAPKLIADEITASICESAYDLYLDFINAKKNIVGFMVFSQSGKTPAILSSYRPKVPIFAFVPDKKICDSITAHFGIEPIVFKFQDHDQVTLESVSLGVEMLKEAKKFSEKNGKLIVIHGNKWGKGTGATTIRII